MPRKKSVSKKELRKGLFARFENFITLHPPAEFRKHLLCVFFDYLSTQVETGFPIDFDMYLGELYDLLQLLDYAEEAAVKS